MIFTPLPSYMKDASRGSLSRELIEMLVRHDRSLDDMLNGFPLTGEEVKLNESDLIAVVRFHQERDIVACALSQTWEELKSSPLRLTRKGLLKYDEDSIEHP